MRSAKAMKNVISILGCVLLSISTFAQSKVTLSFNGNSNSNYNRAYQVIIDGTTYNSNNGNYDNDNNPNPNTITITNLQTGQHSLQVYRLRSNNYGSYGTNNNNSTPQYSSTFNLRQ